MAGLRRFQDNDVPVVADLIWRVLHNHSGSAPETLRNHLHHLFLANPWLDDGISSRVFEDAEGRIIGFFGAVPRRMSIRGRVVRLAFGSNFVVDAGNRAPMIAIQLVKAFMRGTQDVSITDSANEMSRPILRSMGFTAVPIYSLKWARPLKPAQYGLYLIGRTKKSGAMQTLGTVGRPFCAVADLMIAKMKVSPLHTSDPKTKDEELDSEILLQCLATIPAKHWLVPEYNLVSLNWVLDFIKGRNALGTMRKRLVRNGDGKIIGWYIYTLADGQVGEMLQIGAESAAVGTVLDHLFYDARQAGLVGLHGRMEPQFMQELTTKGCFFIRHASWTLAQSEQSDLLSLLQSGTAFFSRLDGEWCLRHGGGDA